MKNLSSAFNAYFYCVIRSFKKHRITFEFIKFFLIKHFLFSFSVEKRLNCIAYPFYLLFGQIGGAR